MEIRYSVALLSKKKAVACWASGGINDTGKEKIRTTRKTEDAFKFSLPTAQAVAKKLASWGYLPVVFDMETNTAVEAFKPTPRPTPEPKQTLASITQNLIATIEELDGKPDPILRELAKPLMNF